MHYRHIILLTIFTRSMKYFFSVILIILPMLYAGIVYAAESESISPEVSTADEEHDSATMMAPEQHRQTVDNVESKILPEENAVTKPVAVVVKYIEEAVLFESEKDKGRYITRKGESLSSGNELRTGKASKAYIKMSDGSKILLRENTNLHMKDYNEVGVKRGKALFSVSKRKKGRDIFRVATRVVMLGIRGTQFLVESAEDDSDAPVYHVYLNNGAIVASPLGESFKYYHKKEMDDFAEYSKSVQAEFDEYKKNEQQEFLEYVTEIAMKENSGLSIQGNEVREISIPDYAREWFDEFEDESIGW